MEKKCLDERRVSNNIVNSGYESEIHYYLDEDGEVVYFKKFKTKVEDEIYEEKCRNKEIKLEILSSLNIPELVTVKDALFKDGIMVGYTMPIIKGKQVETDTRRKIKIDYLNQVRRIMYLLNDQGIYIGDFGTKNIIIDEKGNIRCLDIDNYRITIPDGELKHDIDTRELRRFFKNCGIKTLEDRFMFNELIFCVLGKYDEGSFSMYNLVRHPEEFGPIIKLPRELKTNYNMTVAEEMLFLGKEYHGNILELKKGN